jgi:hypothetical protein
VLFSETLNVAIDLVSEVQENINHYIHVQDLDKYVKIPYNIKVIERNLVEMVEVTFIHKDSGLMHGGLDQEEETIEPPRVHRDNFKRHDLGIEVV